MKLPKFLVGLLIGGLIGSIYWYYQKSTSSEDGALQLLERLAASDARIRDLEAALRKQTPPQKPPEESESSVNSPGAPVQEAVDDLREIEGIGPTYARRLKAAGVSSFAGLAAMSPEEVMAITAVRSAAVAGGWIEAAKERLAG